MLSDGSFMITGLVAHDCSEGNVTDLQNFSVIKVTEYIMQELTSNKPCVPARLNGLLENLSAPCLCQSKLL